MGLPRKENGEYDWPKFFELSPDEQKQVIADLTQAAKEERQKKTDEDRLFEELTGVAEGPRQAELEQLQSILGQAVQLQFKHVAKNKKLSKEDKKKVVGYSQRFEMQQSGLRAANRGQQKRGLATSPTLDLTEPEAGTTKASGQQPNDGQSVDQEAKQDEKTVSKRKRRKFCGCW